MTGAGRNDPCPCGSGKKQKRCCGVTPDAVRGESTGYSQAVRTTALEKLNRFACRSEFENDRALAQVLFWGSYSGELSDTERERLLRNEMVDINFCNFLRLDLDVDDGQTLIDLFLQRRGASLARAERLYLQSLQGSHVGLYEVTEVQPGKGVRLQSLWGGPQNVWIEERTASTTIVRWDLLGARVVQQPDGGFMFEGDLYPLPARFKARAIERLEQDYQVAMEDGRAVPSATFLKRVAFRLHGLWLEAQLGGATPKLATFDGEELEGVKHTFAIDSPSGLVRALDACAELQAEEQDRWVLLEEVDDVFHLLAEFRLAEGELVSTSMCRAHGERARALTLRIAGEAVHHLRTEFQDVGELMEEARRAPREERRDEAPSPEAAALLKRTLDKHYRRWLDQELPALDGSTPRAAAVNITLRPRLVDLLHQMENDEARAPLSDLGAYDFGWVRRELGLERPRPAAHSQYPQLSADLGHFLDRGDLSSRVPPDARRLGLYLGRIAAAASRHESDGELATAIACRRRPFRLACGGCLVVRRDQRTDRLAWHCPDCGDGGTIVGWRETGFDLSARPPLGVPFGGALVTREITFAESDLRRLLGLGHLTAPALALLVSALHDGDRASLSGRPEEFSALALCISLELEARRCSQRAAGKLGELHARLCRAADLETDLSNVALAAELLIHEASRFPSSAEPRADSTPDGRHRVEVQLLDIEPPIRRTLELPSRTTLAELHNALVLAMGWTDSHLHVFQVGERSFGLSELLGEMEVEDSRTALLGELLPRAGDVLGYEYDFGDSWSHELRVLSISSTRPERVRLLDGARACPPEDCGGTPGYANLLEALAAPDDPDHAETLQWIGPDFDPEHFDLERHDQRLERLALAREAARAGSSGVRTPEPSR